MVHIRNPALDWSIPRREAYTVSHLLQWVDRLEDKAYNTTKGCVKTCSVETDFTGLPFYSRCILSKFNDIKCCLIFHFRSGTYAAPRHPCWECDGNLLVIISLVGDFEISLSDTNCFHLGEHQIYQIDSKAPISTVQIIRPSGGVLMAFTRSAAATNQVTCWCGQPATRLREWLQRATFPVATPVRMSSLKERIDAVVRSDVLVANYGFQKPFKIIKTVHGWFESNILISDARGAYIWIKVSDNNHLTPMDAFEVRLAFQQSISVAGTLNVPSVIRTVSGSSTFSTSGYLFGYAIEYLGGDAITFTERLDKMNDIELEDFRSFASLLGKLHADQRNFNHPRFQLLERWSKRTIRQDVEEELSKLKERGSMLPVPVEKQEPYVHLISACLMTMVDACEMSTDESEGKSITMGWNHADIHEGNIMIKDNELWLIDFGDVVYGPLVIDLAFLLIKCLCFERRANETQEGFACLITEYLSRFRLTIGDMELLYPYCVGLLALSILDGLESFGRDHLKAETRKVYILRCIDALETIVYVPQLYDAISSVMSDM